MQFLNLRSGALAVAMLGLAAPAAAQDALCGGAGNGGQWIGGDELSSDIATASTYMEQMALVLGGNEYVSVFSLSQGADVRIEAAGRGAGDTIIAPPPAIGGHVTHHGAGCAGLYGLKTEYAPVNADGYTIDIDTFPVTSIKG